MVFVAVWIRYQHGMMELQNRLVSELGLSRPLVVISYLCARWWQIAQPDCHPSRFLKGLDSKSRKIAIIRETEIDPRLW